jgi:hypothetical protein
MPNNLFEPRGTTTRAQAAVLVTRMSNILNELRAWDSEEIYRYTYRNGVVVISEPPAYSIIENNDVFTVTVYNSNESIRRLAQGDIFVLEPTDHQIEGFAGRVVTAAQVGSAVVITARQPESLDEIFDEFEFKSEIDLLAMADEIILSEELQGLAGVEITRNPTSFVSMNLYNVDIDGITLSGNITLYAPKLQVDITARNVNHLVVTTGAQVNLTASVATGFDRTITLYTIPIKKLGTGIDVPIGLRFHANGQFELAFACELNTEFGIREGTPYQQTNFSYGFDFDVSARVSLSLNIQAKSRVLMVPTYGIQGDFGRGVEVSGAMQNRCPNNVCFVVDLFHVREISSLVTWGALRRVRALQFTLDFAPKGNDYRYFSGGTWHRLCPHSPIPFVRPHERTIFTIDGISVAEIFGLTTSNARTVLGAPQSTGAWQGSQFFRYRNLTVFFGFGGGSVLMVSSPNPSSVILDGRNFAMNRNELLAAFGEPQSEWEGEAWSDYEYAYNMVYMIDDFIITLGFPSLRGRASTVEIRKATQ